MKAKLKYSINDFGDRYRHQELDTRLYAPQFHTPKGYKFDDFGWEIIDEIKTEFQINFSDEATDLIDQTFSELKNKLYNLRTDVEKRMSDRAVEAYLKVKI